MTNGKPVGKARKHHYIPEGYLEGWTGPPNGKLVAFSKYGDRLATRWTHPGGAGYEIDLYSIPALGEAADRIEKQLLGFIDGNAAKALAHAREGSAAITEANRHALTSFVTSLLVRSPESIDAIREGVKRWWRAERPELQEIYDAYVWQPGLPKSVSEGLALLDEAGDEERFLASVLPDLLNHQKIKDFLAKMYWRVIRMPRSAPALLTSDAPLVMTNGLMAADGHFAIPISPTAMIFAARSAIRMDKLLRSMNAAQLARRSNLLVVQRARRFVFASDTSQREFVAEHYGVKQLPAVGQRVGDGDPWKAIYPGDYTPGSALRDYDAWRRKGEP